MNGAGFLDTNILVYCIDAAHPAKQKVAPTIIDRTLTQHSAVISFPSRSTPRRSMCRPTNASRSTTLRRAQDDEVGEAGVKAGAPLAMPISFIASATAATAPRISSGPMAPMQPTRNVSSCVSLPG